MSSFKSLRPVEEELKALQASNHVLTRNEPLTYAEFSTHLEALSDEYATIKSIPFHYTYSEETCFSTLQSIITAQHIRFLCPIRHKHDFFELVCVISGSHTVYLNETPIELTAGDILTISPNVEHAFYSKDDNSILIVIRIRSSNFDEHFSNLLPDDEIIYNFFFKTLYYPNGIPYMLFQTTGDPYPTRQVLLIHKEYCSNTAFQTEALRAMLALLLITLLRNHREHVQIPVIKEYAHHDNTIYILEYMQKHYTSINLAKIAEVFNYSDRQIQRIITNATGKSFSENIKILRMEKGAELLRDTDMSITAIAHELGYFDASNFRHYFRQFYGITPQEFRNSLE